MSILNNRLNGVRGCQTAVKHAFDCSCYYLELMQPVLPPNIGQLALLQSLHCRRFAPDPSRDGGLASCADYGLAHARRT